MADWIFTDPASDCGFGGGCVSTGRTCSFTVTEASEIEVAPPAVLGGQHHQLGFPIWRDESHEEHILLQFIGHAEVGAQPPDPAVLVTRDQLFQLGLHQIAVLLAQERQQFAIGKGEEAQRQQAEERGVIDVQPEAERAGQALNPL